MPITLLKNIKLRTLSCSSAKKKVILHRESPNKHLLGVYVFSCRDLKPNQALFNDGVPSIIFMPNATDEVHLKQDGESKTFKSAWVCRGVIQNTQWEIPPELEYILVLRFRPSSFYSIFDIDSTTGQLSSICNLEDISTPRWAEVVAEMYNQSSIEEKIDYLEQAVAAYPVENQLPFMLQHAIDYIDQRKGNVSVPELLAFLGKSINYKWLQRNFSKYTGVSPKKYISLQRFIYTYGECYTHQKSKIPSVAITNGYYDYSHFLKTFKQYVGVGPLQYAW